MTLREGLEQLAEKTIKGLLGDQVLLGRDLRIERAQAEAFRVAFEEAPWQFRPDALLAEYDPMMLQLLMDSVNWETYGGLPSLGFGATENQRLRTVERSRWFYRWDQLAKRVVNMWTDYGFGETLSIEPEDPTAKEIWNAFRANPRNRALLHDRNLHRQSNALLTDGEIFWSFFTAKPDGEVIMRSVPTEQITEIVNLEKDPQTPLFYKRDFIVGTKSKTLYYPDWMADEGMLERAKLSKNVGRADKQEGGTGVAMMHLAFDTDAAGRGWPLLTTVNPAAAGYRQFIHDRQAVTRSRALITEEVITEGGSRAVKQMRANIASDVSAGWDRNPPPGGGTTEVHNKAMQRKRLPLTTGAGDAQIDGATMAAYAGLGAGIDAGYLGRPDVFQNRAVALAVMAPTIRQWQRYQTLWKSVVEDWFTIVLDQHEKYGIRDTVHIANRAIAIQMDNPTETPLEEVSLTLDMALTQGIIRRKEAAQVILNRPEFGLGNVDQILDEMFPEEEEAEEAELTEVVLLLKDLFHEAREVANTDDQRLAAELALQVLEDMKAGG